jgi:hypothetical protein
VISCFGCFKPHASSVLGRQTSLRKGRVRIGLKIDLSDSSFLPAAAAHHTARSHRHSNMRRVHGVLLLAACVSLLLVDRASGVDRKKFRTCQQTDFCQRLRTNTGHHQSMNYAVEVSEQRGETEGSGRRVARAIGAWSASMCEGA